MSEDHGKALLALVTEGEGFQYAPPSWRADMRRHAKELIAQRDAAIARAERAEADFTRRTIALRRARRALARAYG